MYSSINVLGYEVFDGSLQDLDLSKRMLLNTFSPNSYGIALHDKEFEIALKKTDVLVLDGVGVALGSLLLNGKNIKKIAGQDCFDFFIQLANEMKWKVFFLGSSESTLNKIINRVNFEYPGVEVSAYSPPFKQSFSQEENELIISSINSFKPNILFIGMTAPKQEKWGYQNQFKVDVGIIASIGNVFDWYAGNSKRPGKIWIRLRLEWLIRIILRPEILRRNSRNQALFLRDLFFAILKK